MQSSSAPHNQQQDESDLLQQCHFTLNELSQREAPNKIAELRPLMKNLDLKVIVLTKDVPKELKNKETLH